jgi:hypothetical protein
VHEEVALEEGVEVAAVGDIEEADGMVRLAQFVS